MDVLDDTYKNFSEKFLNEFAPGVSSWRDFDKLDPKLQQMVATGLGFTPDEEGIKRVSSTIRNANRFEESVRSSIDLKNKILEQKKQYEDSKKSLIDLIDSPLYEELGGISDNAKDLYDSADSLREDAYADYKNITEKSKQDLDEAAGKEPEPTWTEKIGAPPIKKDEEDDLAKEAEVPKSLTETKGTEAVAQLSTRELLIEIIKNNGIFASTQEHKINPDGTVDWFGEVSITPAGLINGKLPVKFNLIKGNFRCDNLKLQTLENAPKIVEGIFDCSSNNLKSLEGAPQECGAFNVSGNPLGEGTGLKFGPTKINGASDKKIFGGFVDQTTKIDVYNVSKCKLTTLKDSGLKEIGPGGFNCSFNNLTSLEGMEDIFVGGANIRSFDCSNNPKLTSMKGAPKISPDPGPPNVFGDYNFSNCDIKEIESSLPDRVGNFNISGNNLTTLSFLPGIIDGDLDCTNSRGTKFNLQSLGKDRFEPVGKEKSTLQRVVNVKGRVYTDSGIYDNHIFDINTVNADAPTQNNIPKNSSGVEILDTGPYKITVMDASMPQVGYVFGNSSTTKVTPQNATFKKFTAQGWIDIGYQNFVNSAFFEPSARPTGNFFIDGLNFGAKIETVKVLNPDGSPKVDTKGKPVLNPGFGYWWPIQTFNPLSFIYDTDGLSGKKALDINKKSPISRGFAGSHMLVVNGQVKPNPTWNHGSDSRPRTAVGIRKDGKFVVFATESRIQFKKIGEEMVKLDVVNAINYDSGGSTMKVRDGKIIVASEDPGAGRAVSIITYWGEVTKK
jgi:hypothetical protein